MVHALGAKRPAGRGDKKPDHFWRIYSESGHCSPNKMVVIVVLRFAREFGSKLSMKGTTDSNIIDLKLVKEIPCPE